MIRVAIDGPAGVGKSSSSKALADYFGFAYLDTGAMYRACTWWCLERGVDLDAAHVDEQQVTEIVAAFFTDSHFDISVDPQHPGVFADDVDISEQIRSQEVSSHVSRLAAIIPVRNVLIAAQRAYIAAQSADDSFSHGRGVVAEGRDITDVVEPGAEVRILLTAREEVRQARRNKQEQAGGVGSDDVAKRDAADSKVTHFTEASDGVTTIDNSDIDFGETLDLMIGLVDDAIEEQEYRQYAANLDDYELDEGDEGLLDGSAFSAGGESDRRKAVGVIAVVGRPNVGKSTLVNRILGRRAAVVEDTPGVTRDRVSYDAEWAGTDFKLVDTGGWEADVEGIDSAIASQAQIAVELADSVIFVVDALTGLTQTDERIVKLLRQDGKPVTVAVNKIDDQISEYMAAEFWKLGLGEPYPISAMHGRGVGDLLDEAVAQMKSAEKTSGFLTPSHLRRVALVGRPNVGKSSLLNQLSHSERSVVNELAGTTRDPVDEIVTIDGEDYLFIDTAGIKRRQHKLSGAEYYSSLRTQAAIERSELALVLFDASIPISDQDLKVMSTAVDAGRAVVLVFNKWDLMDEFDRQRMERLWKTEFDRVTWAQRVNLSAKTGWHTNRLAKAMTQALESWDKRIPTGKLNAFLGKIQASHPHPVRGGKQPRILFATQASSRPPRFVIFATGFLEHGYRRFLERSLREEFGFEGSPIQISVNIREKKRRK
ncbi:cytidylate kinase [Bifidobacterium animalis subsp. animalis MCC 1489]|uniref:Multifunctional fusion protein n=1 Tax=Bifidobacterium animalis subsp. animalis IM386 TaxID=1402194 RepID=A0AAV2W250_9BIFI|nr:bifunctional cytidylate kinase/GTPase Der [Bifidobacterium animalis]AFI63013.1 bifunctional cytidylate kinase/GTP-binding protein [Bifidobacterium animalis subsp. animalis ATCC 25527]AYN23650.1 bifunctional cytidylate kinase/GTP-binding protein [Bifidobacterium animalis subsp. animalis]KFI43485.1 bifunctional cytidylate kinase/GTP-binding protein [Bifidobacterium animalis subsp. animalis]KOA65055.1 cytidylate kinase [Bifidobacterium animalis subsp. animalis MCC 1489]CDI67766.1 Bifunctional 